MNGHAAERSEMEVFQSRGYEDIGFEKISMYFDIAIRLDAVFSCSQLRPVRGDRS